MIKLRIRTNSNEPFVLPVVQEVEEEIVNDLKAGKLNHEYLPVLGLQVHEVTYH